MFCEVCGADEKNIRIIRDKYCMSCYVKLLRGGKIEKLKILDFPKQFTDNQNSIFIGSMLGDGNLSKYKQSKRARYRVHRSVADEEYLKWNANIFNNFKPKTSSIDCFDKRTNKIYKKSYFQTRTAEIFATEFDKWYVNGKKIVPKDLKLDPLSIAIWYADDGNLTIRHNKNGTNVCVITLSTDAFSYEDVLFLKNELDNHVPGFVINKHEKGFILRNNRYGKEFLNLVKNHMPPGMERKLV